MTIEVLPFILLLIIFFPRALFCNHPKFTIIINDTCYLFQVITSGTLKGLMTTPNKGS